MFTYAGRRDTYDEDYAHLSSIAHGAPASLVHGYSEAVVPVHDDRHVPQLLVYGSRYALATTMVWNDIIHALDTITLEELMDALANETGDGSD